MLSQCWGHHLSLYNLLVLLPTDRKSLRPREKTGKGLPLPKMYKGLISLDRFETVWLHSIRWLELSLLTFSEKETSRSQCFFFFSPSAKITQCSFFHVFCPCFFSPKTSANAFRSLRRLLDFASKVLSLPCLPAVAAVVVGLHSAACSWEVVLLQKLGEMNYFFFSFFLFFLTLFNSLTVLTPQLSALSEHDEPWHHWI